MALLFLAFIAITLGVTCADVEVTTDNSDQTDEVTEHYNRELANLFDVIRNYEHITETFPGYQTEASLTEHEHPEQPDFVELPDPVSEPLQMEQLIQPEHRQVDQHQHLEYPCQKPFSEQQNAELEHAFSTESYEPVWSSEDDSVAEQYYHEPEEPCDGSQIHQNDPLQVGSIRGIPGLNFPDYCDIPLTSFTCADKKHIPGFYADLETGCQVFHVCWPHRRESFLCPLGTIFNQAILACDYWYSVNCSLSPLYYDVNVIKEYTGSKDTPSNVNVIIDAEKTAVPVPIKVKIVQEVDAQDQVAITPIDQAKLTTVLKLLPIKAKVTVYPEVEVRPVEPVEEVQTVEPRPVVQWVKQKPFKSVHTVKPVNQILQQILQLSGHLVKEVGNTVPQLVQAGLSLEKQKAVKPKIILIPSRPQIVVQPSVKVVKVKPQVHVPPSVQTYPPKRKPLPIVSSRFVKPIYAKVVPQVKIVPQVKVVPQQQVLKQVVRMVPSVKAPSVKHVKAKYAADAVFRTIHSSNEAIGQNILPITRDAIANSYIKLWKSKKY